MEIQETNLDYNDKNKKTFINLKKEITELNKRFKKAVQDADSRIKLSQLVSCNTASTITNTHTNSKALSKEKLIEMSDTHDEAVYKQFNKLEEAQRNILDIENRGNSISRELNTQTEVMLRVNSNIDGMNEGLTASGSLIKKMWRRETRNKLIIATVAIFFVFIFVTILFMKLSSGGEVRVVNQGSASRLTNEDNFDNNSNNNILVSSAEFHESNNYDNSNKDHINSELSDEDKKVEKSYNKNKNSNDNIDLKEKTDINK